jgi:hypothetical protein
LPDAEEMQTATSFLAQSGGSEGNGESGSARGLEAFCQALLATAEFRNLD